MSDLTITDIDRTVVRLPYRDVPRPNMDRWIPHWRYSEITEVTVEIGPTGVGETMLYYTWGTTEDEDVERALGANAMDLLWDDDLGAGLQMALFDAVGRGLDVPARRLLGTQVRDRVPLSWWAMDMPAEDWLAEAERAIDEGYTELKVKGRPWWDLREVVATLSEELPAWFGIDIDFNETLLDAERALPILEELEQYPQVETFESPIPQEDVPGSRQLCAELDTPIAYHYGRPPGPVSLRMDLCDGFVLNQGAEATMRQGAAVDAVDKPLWLQLVGSGITTAFAVQFGSVLDAARWPAITCYQLYEETLVESEFDVEDGEVAVPDGPGLGVRLDRDAVDRLAVDRPDEQPRPECLVRTTFENGRELYFATGYQMQRHAERGEFPFYERDVTTEVLPLDSEERQDLHERAAEEPVRINPF